MTREERDCKACGAPFRRRSASRLGASLAAALISLLAAGCGNLSGLNSGEAVNSEPETQLHSADAKPLPKLEDLMQPGPLGEKAMGKPGAPVTVIQYASLTCPVCANFQRNTFPRFKKAYIDTGKVYFIWREFPIGHSSGAAALAVRCAPEKQYFKLNERFLLRQPEWVAQEVKTDAIYNLVKDTGVKREQFDSCLTNQTINDGLVWVKERGRQFGVNGTPTFFINGQQRIRGGLSFEEMQKIIDPLLSAPPAQAAAPGRQA